MAFALAAPLIFCDRIVKPEEGEQILAVFSLLGRDSLQPV